ncbi:MAG TPA: hypothetical protein VL463_10960 [Kofleriaceae bacterium]|nr:hypothetical protein [Kofleriaceae bacterium]
MSERRFAFRPRYRGVAWTAMGTGAVLDVVALVFGFPWPAIASGAVGVGLGSFYLLSPAWTIEVVTTDDALEVQQKGERRFRLAWHDVVRVTASPSTKTCFVDGGDPERSLLVPGDGAPAPYTIADKDALYDLIVARVPREKLEQVELLNSSRGGARSGAD